MYDKFITIKYLRLACPEAVYCDCKTVIFESDFKVAYVFSEAHTFTVPHGYSWNADKSGC